MPDHMSSAVEKVADGGAERAAVCKECVQARADLRADVEANETELSDKLAAWVTASYPDILPTEVALTAAQQFQAEEQAFDPDFNITAEDPALFEAHIRQLAAQSVAAQRNQTTTGQVADGVPAEVPTGVGQESGLLTEEDRLNTENHRLLLDQADKTNTANQLVENRTDKTFRNVELLQLQGAFEQLRENGVGTAEALRQVISQAQNPETKQHLNAILSKVALLQTVLPDKPDVVNRLLNTAGLNLTVATVAGSFAGFMNAAETDDALTEDDRASLRRLIEGGDRRLKTGTQVRSIAIATTKDPATGETVPLHTEANKAEVVPGVFTYTETGQNVILEVREGSLKRQIDVTGLDGVSIGTVAEIMGLAALAETSGAGGFIKHVYGVDFERFADRGVDPLTLVSIRQKLTHLIDAGHDGEIMQPQRQRLLLETQMRLVSPDGSLLAWADDPNGYRENVVALGLDSTPVLEAFGTFTQLHSGTGTISRDQVQWHLHKRFPDLVSDPANGTEGDLIAHS